MDNGYKIRSITLHVPNNIALDILENRLDDVLADLSEAKSDIELDFGLEVETIRLVADILDPVLIEHIIDDIAETAESYGALVSIGPVSTDLLNKRSEILTRIVENRLFFNILMENFDWPTARKISEFIHMVAEKEPSLATLFGVNVYGKPIVTPYYPLASSLGERAIGVSVSLTYPNYLLRSYMKQGYKGLFNSVVEAGKKALAISDAAASALGPSYFSAGVDLSVAPWMQESSLGLVEYVAGVRMPEPGFLLGIYRVNKTLSEASQVIRRTVGFNEVQLPVAEDLKLKKRVAELDTTARDLARFSCLCLAGLDLAVVPASIDRVAGLILDVAACSHSKGKPLGVRIIPVRDVEPGEKVWLDKFGETPVIPL